MARGGLGLGAVCTTGTVGATTGAATTGWAEAAMLVKKQLVFKGGQVGFVVMEGINNCRYARDRWCKGGNYQALWTLVCFVY